MGWVKVFPNIQHLLDGPLDRLSSTAKCLVSLLCRRFTLLPLNISHEINQRFSASTQPCRSSRLSRIRTPVNNTWGTPEGGGKIREQIYCAFFWTFSLNERGLSDSPASESTALLAVPASSPASKLKTEPFSEVRRRSAAHWAPVPRSCDAERRLDSG